MMNDVDGISGRRLLGSKNGFTEKKPQMQEGNQDGRRRGLYLKVLKKRRRMKSVCSLQYTAAGKPKN